MGESLEDGTPLPAIVEEEEQKISATAHAIAVQAREQTRAKFIIAQKFPRDWDIVRERIHAHCRRVAFAEKALYTLRFGGNTVKGETIRFVEAALQAMGNVETSAPILYDDEESQTVRVMVTDLERNVSYTKDVQILKTVERRTLKRGQNFLSKRVNSNNKTVYIIPATEQDITSKRNAFISKAIRTEGLRLLPIDIREEAREVLKQTIQGAYEDDPENFKRKIIDSFAEFGVRVSDLKEYLGHDLDALSASEITELQAIKQSLEDGEASWYELTGQVTEAEQEDAPTTLDDVVEKRNKKKTKKKSRRK